MNDKLISYIKEYWITHRNDSAMKNIFAVNRYVFPIITDILSSYEDIAYISIGETKGCIEYNNYDEYGHHLESSDTVLNVDFDDVDNDTEIDGYKIMAISEEQSREIYYFICKNKDKHIIVHCRAGRSRSQGVVRAILDMFADTYQECYLNGINPCTTPNMEVVRKIKRQFYINSYS